MPPVRSARNRKPPPDGFEDLEDTLLEFGNKMKDAENASHEGKKRHEVLWPIFQISHQRERILPSLVKLHLTETRLGSRYIYELYYEKEAISKQLYEWLLKNGYADATLIAKWKKQGYEKVGALLHHRQVQDGMTDQKLIALLSSMRPNQRDKFQLYLHLSRSQGTAEGGSNHRMC